MGPRISIGVFFVIVVLLGGCGSGDEERPRLTKAEYQQRLQRIYLPYATSTLKLSLAVERAPSRDQAKPLLERLAGGMQRAADRLNDLRPPEGVEGLNLALAASLRDLADWILTEARRPTGGGLRPYGSFTANLRETPGARRLTDAANGLERAGYVLVAPQK